MNRVVTIVLGLYVACAAALALTACNDESSVIDLTAANNGETIQAPLHSKVKLTLDTNPTTGFKWDVVSEPDPRILSFVSGKYQTPVPGVDGASGTEMWLFNAVGKGTTIVTLTYSRPFNPTPQDKGYVVTVNVR